MIGKTHKENRDDREDKEGLEDRDVQIENRGDRKNDAMKKQKTQEIKKTRKDR